MARPKRPQMSQGLAVLLGETTAMSQVQSGGVSTLPIKALRPGVGQPRRTFDDGALDSLAASIRAEGVLQPLLVRPIPGGHEIVAGERRWRAAQLAGLKDVPVLIRELDERQALVAALLENLQRENLNPIDEVDGKLALVGAALGLTREEARARLMQLLKEEPGEDHERLDELFKGLGESWASFAKNKIRILNWPIEVVEAMRAGLPLSVAGVVAAAPQELQATLLDMAQAGRSRAELREVVQQQAEKSRSRGETENNAATAVQRLSSRRFLAGLDDTQRKALAQWLARMPTFMRQDSTKD